MNSSAKTKKRCRSSACKIVVPPSLRRLVCSAIHVAAKKKCKDVMFKQATLKVLKSVSPLHPVPTAIPVPS